MSDRPTFKAKVDISGRGQISINDFDISNICSGFTVKSKVNEVTEVNVALIGVELDLDIDGLIAQVPAIVESEEQPSETS